MFDLSQSLIPTCDGAARPCRSTRPPRASTLATSTPARRSDPAGWRLAPPAALPLRGRPCGPGAADSGARRCSRAALRRLPQASSSRPSQPRPRKRRPARPADRGPKPPSWSARARHAFSLSEGIVLSRKIADVKAFDGVDFTTNPSKPWPLRESGCGKTTTGRCNPALDASYHGGRDPVRRTTSTACTQRGGAGCACAAAAVIFQDPYISLNPRMKVGDIIAERSRCTTSTDAARRPHAAERRRSAASIPSSPIAIRHELSGASGQRVGHCPRPGARSEFIVCD